MPHRHRARCSCAFVPPFVQSEIAKNASGPAADAAQEKLAATARKKRTAAIDKATAGAVELAPPATGTSRREV